tara:strand:+ start:215 stop:589 length:375 start_codon:yes stop_codon:yes gene_type:complete
MAKRPNIVFRKKSEGNGIISYLNIDLNSSAFVDVRNLYLKKEVDFTLKTQLSFTKVSDYIYEVTGNKKGFYSIHLEVETKKDRDTSIINNIDVRSNTLILIVQETVVLLSSSSKKSSSNLKSSS